MATEADTLKDIRDDVQADQDAWREVVDEGDKDMLCVSGHVWEAMDPEGLKLRNELKRPALEFDEFGQHMNALINQIRADKRAIKVSPVGFGANDKTAQFRADRIRQIEYRSNAQSAYTCMFENAVQRSYGYLRIRAKHVSANPDPSKLSAADFDQELLIEPIVNPNTVTPDCHSVKADGSDMRRCTIRDTMRTSEFRREYPGAKITDFRDWIGEAPGWVKTDSVTVAEHWRIETTSKKLLLVEWAPGVEQGYYEADYLALKKRGMVGVVKRDRPVDAPAVKQYITNGVEVLETVDWPGEYIPIVQCLGKVLYVTQGGVTKRVILSLPRLARSPAMYYCYIRTCEAEAIGGVPRATFVGYKGQFSGVENDWKRANHEPVAYLEANPIVDSASGAVLPLPQRNNWDPAIGNLEMGAEAGRRAIQAGLGSMPLPTQAQRMNEKSGIALKQITEGTQRGQYHFVDHFEESLCRVGVILDDLIPHYDDTARDVTVRDAKDAVTIQRINDPGNPDSIEVSKDGKSVGLHDITISTGPGYDSQRELAGEFADTVISNPNLLQIVGPQKMAKLIAIAIKLKNVGPLGDEMAETIDPQPPQDGQPPDPGMLMQQLQGMQQQLQQAGQMLQQADQAMKTEQAKQQAAIQKAQIDAQVQLQLQQMRDATSIRVAEINAGVRVEVGQTSAETEALALAVKVREGDKDREHATVMTALDHAHQADVQDKQRQDQMAASAAEQDLEGAGDA